MAATKQLPLLTPYYLEKGLCQLAHSLYGSRLCRECLLPLCPNQDQGEREQGRCGRLGRRGRGKPGVASRLFCNRPQGHAHSPSFPRCRLGRLESPRGNSRAPAGQKSPGDRLPSSGSHTLLRVGTRGPLHRTPPFLPPSIPPRHQPPTCPSHHDHSSSRKAICTGSLRSRAQRAQSR